MENLLPVLISVICSVLIAITGWLILFRNAKRLASRSETYSLVNNINDLLSDIKNASDEFWLKEENNDSPIIYDTYVGLKLRDIQELIKIIKIRHLPISDYKTSIFQIRMACTLNSTKASNMSSSQDRAQILRGIYAVISVCETGVYESFSKQYPPIK